MKARPVLVVALAIAAVLLVRCDRAPIASEAPHALRAGSRASAEDDGSLQRAIAARADGVPVTGRGVVERLLSDDRDGSPHQRIIVRVAGGNSVLIAHNLELGARIAPLAEGDILEFAGDYAWNPKGGVVHWTHADPRGGHRAGWLRRVPR
jgi:hypothetical protein